MKDFESVGGNNGKTESIDLEKMMYDLDLDGEADVRAAIETGTLGGRVASDEGIAAFLEEKYRELNANAMADGHVDLSKETSHSSRPELERE